MSKKDRVIRKAAVLPNPGKIDAEVGFNLLIQHYAKPYNASTDPQAWKKQGLFDISAHFTKKYRKAYW